MQELNLQNYLKYCLGYLRITTKPVLRKSQDSSITLPGRFFSLERFLIEEDMVQEVELPTFSDYSPLDLEEETEEVKAAYEEEKKLATSLEGLYNKFRNDEFTKELKLNFGFYKISLPKGDADVIDSAEEEQAKKTQGNQPIYQPLFSVPVSIERYSHKKATAYKLHIFDTNLQVLLAPLESVLGESLYYDAMEEIGKFELAGELTLPNPSLEVLHKVWEVIRNRLKNTDALFDDGSFTLDEIQVALTPRVNYFLTEDLLALSKLEEEELEGSSLLAWASDEGCDIDAQIPTEGQLYFPFIYDKYQLQALSILENKCSVVHGPPGTGKSQTISNLLCHLAAKGNKVLFVSQKPQALKVVKDRLRELNIKYLFAYVPNPASKVLDYTDEQDGVAAQLSNIEQYLSSLSFRAEGNSSLEPVAGEKAVLRDGFNGSISEQRYYYSLEQEYEGLSSYEVNLQDPGSFQENFNAEFIGDTNGLIKRMENLRGFIHDYEAERLDQDGPWRERFRLVIEKIEDGQLSEHLRSVCAYIEKSGYDGHGKFGRGISNIKFRTYALLSVKLRML